MGLPPRLSLFRAGAWSGGSEIHAAHAAHAAHSAVATGGVGPGDVAAYLAAGAAFVGMGGALVDAKRIAAGDKPAILAAARAVAG